MIAEAEVEGGEPLPILVDHVRSQWLVAISLTAILAIAVAVRVAWVAYVNVHPFDGRVDDTVFYYASARSLADALEYRDQFGRFSAHWPPGYPLTLAAAFFAAGSHLAVAKALNVAIGAATCALAYALGARAFGRGAGLLAALLLAVLPGHAFWSTLVMTETLFTFVFLLSLYLALRWTLEHHEAHAWQLVALGVLLAYATLIRAEAVLLAPLFVLLWLAVLPRRSMALRYGAIVCAAFAVVIGAWTIRNAVRFDDLIVLRSGAPGAVSNALDPDYLDRPGRFTAPAPPLEDTLGHIVRHPWEIAPMQLDKLHHLYRNDHEAVDWVMHEQPPLSESEAANWRRVADVPYAVLMLAVLLAAPLWLRVRERPRLVVAFGIVAWTAIEITFWPEPRYHTPVLPLFCICAAAGVAWVGRAAASRVAPSD